MPTALFLATIIGISDGDTLTVLRDQQPVKIRLAEIDAPSLCIITACEQFLI